MMLTSGTSVDHNVDIDGTLLGAADSARYSRPWIIYRGNFTVRDAVL